MVLTNGITLHFLASKRSGTFHIKYSNNNDANNNKSTELTEYICLRKKYEEVVKIVIMSIILSSTGKMPYLLRGYFSLKTLDLTRRKCTHFTTKSNSVV
jgi:hypothetical protein